MRRLKLFLTTVSWGTRLQLLMVVLYLSYQVWFDSRRGYLPVTFAIMLLTGLLGRLLLPLMMAYPRLTFRVWGSFGTVFLLLSYLVSGQRWWWTVAAHFGREIVMCQYLSCGYWFVSQLRLAQERLTSDIPEDDEEFAKT
ncbi:hypothetical protein [Schlesneria sp. DSM 10557]|uniref:hypothetical protein n=1 Tax=Schlesneria sp. DSM 10557 TaxID=3044399 RepID=UPI0035A05E3D